MKTMTRLKKYVFSFKQDNFEIDSARVTRVTRPNKGFKVRLCAQNFTNQLFPVIFLKI